MWAGNKNLVNDPVEGQKGVEAQGEKDEAEGGCPSRFLLDIKKSLNVS